MTAWRGGRVQWGKPSTGQQVGDVSQSAGARRDLAAHIFNASPIDSALEEFLPDGASFGLVVSLVEVGSAPSDIRRGGSAAFLIKRTRE